MYVEYNEAFGNQYPEFFYDPEPEDYYPWDEDLEYVEQLDDDLFFCSNGICCCLSDADLELLECDEVTDTEESIKDYDEIPF